MNSRRVRSSSIATLGVIKEEFVATKIIGAYFGLIRRPYRFVIHETVSSGVDLYRRHIPRSLREFLLDLFTELSAERAEFMKTLAALDDERFMKSRQQRRFVAENRKLLYSGSPHLAERYVARFDGYWVATNVGAIEVSRVSRLACQAAGISSCSITKLQL